MKRWISIFLLVLLISLGVACTKEEKKEAVDPTPVVEANPVEPTDIAKVEIGTPYIAPLTGLGSITPINDRIKMVVIENHSLARPQSGLNKADMVYEILAEGGITRFAAFYQSEYPENVGPVRSIRPYLIRLGEGFDALLVHAGWSPEAESIIKKEKLPNINGLFLDSNPKYFWRIKDRKAPHNMYTDFKNIEEVAKKFKYKEEGNTPHFLFREENEQITGEQALKVMIKYNKSYQVGYTYDEATKLYKRSINDEPHIDLITGEQLATSNILVIETKHKTLDSVGRLSIDLNSGGKGYLFQQGKGMEITWRNLDGVIYPFKDGEQVKLTPGKTWVNIIPDEVNWVKYE